MMHAHHLCPAFKMASVARKQGKWFRHLPVLAHVWMAVLLSLLLLTNC